MKTDKLYHIIIAAFLCYSWMPISTCLAEDLTFTSREMIRNGGFENTSYSAWLTNFFRVANNAALAGGNGMSSYECANQNANCFFAQPLPIPSQLESATLSFSYRVMANESAGEPRPINFEASLLRSDGLAMEDIPPMAQIGTIHTDTFSQMTQWQQVSIDLDPGLIRQIQTAHTEGEFVYLIFALENASNALEVHFDNISFTVNGAQPLPPLRGAIAFFETKLYSNPEHVDKTLYVLDPGKTSAAGDFNPSYAIYRNQKKSVSIHADDDVKWKPDGSSIAFIAETADEMFSPFYGDIFTISPDGSGLTRIINPPLQTDIRNGDFPRVTVSGTVIDLGNSLGAFSPVFCLHGAMDCIYLTFGEKFTIPNVAILDGNTEAFSRIGVMYWFGMSCSVGIEYEPFVKVPIINGQVDLGTIPFDANMCIEFSTDGHTPHGLSWSRDGSGIWTGLMASFQKFDPTASTVPVTWNSPFSGETIPTSFDAHNMQWSPVEDRYLYMDLSTTGNVWYRIFIASVGGQPQLLLEDVEDVTPAWLPDGSGFIYVRDTASNNPNIFHYDLATGEIKRLTYFFYEHIQNVSVSPEGAHIVFEKCAGRNSCELWVMDRLNPANMWQIIEGGYYSGPDWSLTDVSLAAPSNGQSNSGSGSGSKGSGGCFIEILKSARTF